MSAASSCVCSGSVSDSVRTSNSLYRSPLPWPRPWTTASARPIAAIWSRTADSETGAGVANRACVPPLKSIPRLRPWTISATTLTPIATSERMNHSRRRPTTSIRCHRGISVAVAPMKRGLSNHLKPESTVSIARVATTAVSIEIAVPIRSISAKPRTLAVATANSTSAVIAVTALASTIVWNPFV